MQSSRLKRLIMSIVTAGATTGSLLLGAGNHPYCRYILVATRGYQ